MKLRRFPKYVCHIFTISVLFVLTSNCSVFAGDNLNETAREYVYSIFDTGRLSQEASRRYAASGINRITDSTMRIAWVIENWEHLDLKTKDELRYYVNPDALRPGGDGKVLSRMAPLQGEVSTNSEHFQIYYSTTDANNAVSTTDVLNSNLESGANGIPDFIDRMALYLERSFDKEVSELGFSAPPLYQNEAYYTVYVVDLYECGYLQDPVAEYIGNCNNAIGITIPLGDTFPKSSMMVLDRSYVGLYDLMFETIGHEFFHSIQFGLQDGPPVSGNLWYYEGTAVWMEDQISPLNSYIEQYLSTVSDVEKPCDNFFNCTNYPVEADSTGLDNGLYVYGKIVLFKYLTEYLGNSDAVKDFQEMSISTKNGVETLRQYVSETVKKTMVEFILDFGKSFIMKENYSDGLSYAPEAGFKEHVISGSELINNTDGVLRHYSYVTHDLTNSGDEKVIYISGTGEDGVAYAVIKCADALSGCESVDPDDGIAGFGGAYKHVYVVVANGAIATENPSYQINVTVEAPVEYTVSMEASRWNLVFMPVEPPGSSPSAAFKNQDVEKYLASTYAYLDEDGVVNNDFIVGAPLWIFNAETESTISVFALNTTFTSISVDVTDGDWIYIGTPDASNPTAYSDDNVILTSNSVDYNLSEAIAAGLIGDLFDYDRGTGDYVVVTPQTGILQPWTAYAFKGKFNGSIKISK